MSSAEGWARSKNPATPSTGERQHEAKRLSTTFAMTVDVEDYFQVEAFASTIDRGDWEHLPWRVDRNTQRLLDILAESDVSGTFFMLGWVAQRHPALVRRIVAEGHELASHGFAHIPADRQQPEAFRSDIHDGKRLLEDIGGVRISGYRAPTFSIGPDNTWAHAILADEGYLYSSSIYPRGLGQRHGSSPPQAPFAPSPGIVEIPLTTVRLFGVNVPASGGGYFRLFPYCISEWLLARVEQANTAPAIFYVHPWEIDPGQPRQSRAPILSRFRHYLNLEQTEKRLRRLLHRFTWSRMDRVFLAPPCGPRFTP